jgi:hypothetical protein
MCYFLYIASPLTLSEVRSMVPEGVTVDLASPTEQQGLRASHRGIQTVARLLIGRCSCDFIRPRDPNPHEDERHLRERYRRLGTDRALTISGLERHRAGAQLEAPAEGWSRALVDFVREHARNAGPSVFQLAFLAPGSTLSTHPPLRRIPVDRITPDLERWLVEDAPVLVTR